MDIVVIIIIIITKQCAWKQSNRAAANVNRCKVLQPIRSSHNGIDALRGQIQNSSNGASCQKYCRCVLWWKYLTNQEVITEGKAERGLVDKSQSRRPSLTTFATYKNYIILCLWLSGRNHLVRHSERGKKTRRTKEEVGRQHQGMDRPGVQQVPEDSGEQGKMEKTSCRIICGAPTTLTVKGLIMIMMMTFFFFFARSRPTRLDVVNETTMTGLYYVTSISNVWRRLRRLISWRKR